MILFLYHETFNKYMLNVDSEVRMTYSRLIIRELGYIMF